MLREAMLIVPKRDNFGNDCRTLRAAICRDLVKAFGGCTARSATGYWNGGKAEPVTELVAACEPTAANESTLRKLAQQIGETGKQLAVYVRYPTGNVEIVRPCSKS